MKKLGALNISQSLLPRTPFYCYSQSHLETVYEAFRDAIKKHAASVNFQWHFALKANANEKILAYYVAQGAGVDIVSGGELHVALHAGFAPDKIVFSGAGKSDNELKLAIQCGVGQMNIESESEIDRLAELCESQQKEILFSVRLNPDVDAKTHPYISTGLWDHKFGVDAEEANKLYLKYAKHRYLKAAGVSMHIGSQLLDLNVLHDAINKAVDFAKKLQSQGLKLTSFDVGGGLGINYSEIQNLADFEGYAKAIAYASQRWREELGEDVLIRSECGRALCAQAGFIVSKVIAIKKTKKKNFLIVDASMTELMRPALYQAKHPVKFFREGERRRNLCGPALWEVVGPVCESTDVLAREVALPEIAEGDFVVIEGSGAYGFVLSHSYNSRALPAEHWCDREGHLTNLQESRYLDSRVQTLL